MTPTRLLIGQILIVVAIMVLGVWAATQWAAAMLGYQPRLGAPWFLIGELPIYRPWALFAWWFHFMRSGDIEFAKVGASTLIIVESLRRFVLARRACSH
jgi:type IV secretion system protein VirD4